MQLVKNESDLLVAVLGEERESSYRIISVMINHGSLSCLNTAIDLGCTSWISNICKSWNEPKQKLILMCLLLQCNWEKVTYRHHGCQCLLTSHVGYIWPPVLETVCLWIPVSRGHEQEGYVALMSCLWAPHRHWFTTVEQDAVQDGPLVWSARVVTFERSQLQTMVYEAGWFILF